jgi:GDPmannose 4,6-dehydratase
MYNIYMSKTALITGINGMDGSHLADFLLEKGYKVYGIERWKSSYNHQNLEQSKKNIEFLRADLSDQNSITKAIHASNPDEIYNLAAQSFVGESWTVPEMTSDITGIGLLRVLESVREINKSIRVFQATSNELFSGTNGEIDEHSYICPNSPYGASKAYAHFITNSYRDHLGLYAVSGILFNHESERRSLQFVTRKITDGVAQIAKGKLDKIMLGNIESERDWGYAPDYVQGMWMSLQRDVPDTYVFSTGKLKTIKDFLQSAFKVVGIDNWQDYVGRDDRFYRPYDKRCIWGNSSKAKDLLGWQPQTNFDDWVKKMVLNDLELQGK